MSDIALIGDIHGNLPALEAVAADIKKRGITHIYNLGDMCGFGPDGEEAVNWCRENCEVNLIGNWEDFFINHKYSEHPKAKKFASKLSSENLEYFNSLPLSHKMWISGKRLHLLHGRPLSGETMWFENPPEKLNFMFTAVEDQFPPSIVGYADLHRQFQYDFHNDEKTLFNTGSVGASFGGGCYASYAIIHGDIDSRVSSPISFEFVKLPYDTELAVKNAEKQADWFPVEAYIKSIRNGIWQKVE